MRTDKAHQQTDKILIKLENDLRKVYQSNYKELKKKMLDILSKMELDKGKLTAQQRYVLAMKYDRLEKMIDQLTISLKDINSECVKMINNQMLNVYSVNNTFESNRLNIYPSLNKNAIKGVLTKEIVPFEKLAIDTLKNSELIRNNLTRELLNGIMQGDSINGIATRIKGVMETSLKDSIRIARTETTRVENKARYDVGKQAENAGLKVVKEWVATHDSRTREWHNEADGQQVPLDEPFIVGGEEIMYPADPNASAENVINCRCTMINVVLDINK